MYPIWLTMWKTEDAAEIVHRGRAQNARHHGEARDPQKDRVRIGHVGREDQREDPDQRVDPDLGQEPREIAETENAGV
jgi:hypothetical protein